MRKVQVRYQENLCNVKVVKHQNRLLEMLGNLHHWKSDVNVYLEITQVQLTLLWIREIDCVTF